MSERWMHKPRTVNVWEVRSALRYGSAHEKHVKTEDAARAYAEKKIKAAGGVGKITCITRYSNGGILYYDEYEDDV